MIPFNTNDTKYNFILIRQVFFFWNIILFGFSMLLTKYFWVMYISRNELINSRKNI